MPSRECDNEIAIVGAFEDARLCPKTDGRQLPRLRPRRERPRGHRAAESRDEFATPHAEHRGALQASSVREWSETKGKAYAVAC